MISDPDSFSHSPVLSKVSTFEIGDKLYQIQIADFTKDRDDYHAKLNSYSDKNNKLNFELLELARLMDKTLV